MARPKIKYDFNPIRLAGSNKRPRGDKRAQIYNEVKNEVLQRMQSFLDRGSSPVAGVRFKRLSDDYADAKKSGDKTPDLELTGAMRNSISIEEIGGKLRVTVSDSQQGKADGHCNFSGASKLPKRRFIPNEKDGETFKKSIINTISSIVSEKLDGDD